MEKFLQTIYFHRQLNQHAYKDFYSLACTRNLFESGPIMTQVCLRMDQPVKQTNKQQKVNYPKHFTITQLFTHFVDILANLWGCIAPLPAIMGLTLWQGSADTK